MSAARPCAAPRTVFAGGSPLGHVEPTAAGFVGRMANGAIIGNFASEREAVGAIHDHARCERIERARRA